MQNPERFMYARIAAAALAVGSLCLQEQDKPAITNTEVIKSDAVQVQEIGVCAMRACELDVPAKTVPRHESRATRSRRTVRVTDVQLYPSDAQFDLLASCESTSRWHINTGNGYYGGIQFDLQTWRSNGGLKFATRPDLATRSEQITIGRRTFHSRSSSGRERGWNPWPACSRKLHLR